MFIIGIFIFSPLFTFANEQNAGFVQGLWYSPEPVFAGVPTRIYIALRNNTEHDLTATIRFSDNGKRIGTGEVSALSGRLAEAWVDWMPTEGEHTIVASASDASLHIIGGSTESVTIEGMVASSTQYVDIDTDEDGVGNREDADDDDDAISDDEETKRGSNPLVPEPRASNEVLTTEEPVKETQSETTKNDEGVETSRGLEQYVDDGMVGLLLENTTSKIETARHSLDAYREKRNEAFQSKINDTPVADEDSSIDTATITRTKIDAKNNFLATFIAGVSSLLSLVWTFLLFLTSHTLSHPALLELILLIGILYVVYRTARRLGRRPKYKDT